MQLIGNKSGYRSQKLGDVHLIQRLIISQIITLVVEQQ